MVQVSPCATAPAESSTVAVRLLSLRNALTETWSIVTVPDAPAVATAVNAGPVMRSTDPPAWQVPSGSNDPAHALNRPAGSPFIAPARAPATQTADSAGGTQLGDVHFFVIH